MLSKITKQFLFLITGGVILLSACDREAPEEQKSPIPASELQQLLPPQPGEELAVMRTNMGDVKIKFFPEEAPMAVENFITHAKNGYYDGVIFHRVIKDFMIQGGDPEGTGMGGESIWGGGFGYEGSLKLRHFRGALSMAHSSLPDSNGSQFYIVQNSDIGEENKESLISQSTEMADQVVSQDENGNDVRVSDIYSKPVVDAYVNLGGTPWLDLATNPSGHTVFGQVVEGMDIVDSIANVAVDESDRPREEVKIIEIVFETAQ